MAAPLIAFPLSEEQRRIQELVRGLADSIFRERAARWDEREEYPWDNIKELKGYSRDCPVERMVRAAHMFTVAGGTVQMLRNLVGNRVLGRAGRHGD